MRYAGLTWDHPRGYNALAAAASALDESIDGLRIHWDTHSLEGFEVRPIAETCAAYDLVVLDHPHIGEAIAADCLVPLEDVFNPEEIKAIEADVVGPCLSSYHYAGKHWALPLDAATQVMAYRQDLCRGPAPQTWGQVLELSEQVPVALSLAGPHAVLTYMSICTALGEPPAVKDPETLVSPQIGALALGIMSELYARGPAETIDFNPIQLLQHMARPDNETVALCPLIYGYVNYAAPTNRDRPLTFTNAPRIDWRGPPGSVLGGTGIGITKRCPITPALISHLRWLMSRDCQGGFIPRHQGQPSLRSAWTDEGVNEAWGNFYRNTRDTLEEAYVRPRHPGVIRFLIEGAACVRAGLASGLPVSMLVGQIQDTYSRNRTPGTER